MAEQSSCQMVVKPCHMQQNSHGVGCSSGVNTFSCSKVDKTSSDYVHHGCRFELNHESGRRHCQNGDFQQRSHCQNDGSRHHGHGQNGSVQHYGHCQSGFDHHRGHQASHRICSL